MRPTFYHLLALAVVIYGGYQVLFTGNTIVGLLGLALAALLLYVAPKPR